MLFNVILGAGLALSILLSAHPVSAVGLEDRAKDAFTNPPITVENPDDPIITPMDLQLILLTNHSSYAAYEKSFTLDPANGESANLWIKNTSTDTLYAKITIGTLSPLEVPISKGTQKTITLAAGVKQNVHVYIYSSTGHKVDMTVSARQF